MTITQINDILAGTFTDDNDRKYWENKKAEIIRKMDGSEENDQYFTEMAIYNR